MLKASDFGASGVGQMEEPFRRRPRLPGDYTARESLCNRSLSASATPAEEGGRSGAVSRLFLVEDSPGESRDELIDEPWPGPDCRVDSGPGEDQFIGKEAMADSRSSKIG